MPSSLNSGTGSVADAVKASDATRSSTPIKYRSSGLVPSSPTARLKNALDYFNRPFVRIATHFDISTDRGVNNLAVVVWFCFVAWCLTRISIAASKYPAVAKQFENTNRQSYDYPYVWQALSVGIFLLALVYQAIIYHFKPEQLSHATTGVYMQGIVSISIVMYVDRLQYGTHVILCVFPLLAAVFRASGAVVVVGWMLCTSAIVLVTLGDMYFPPFLRYAVEASPIVYCFVYVLCSFLVMLVPKLYQYWMVESLQQQDQVVKFTTEVAELLVTMNTDEANKAIEEREKSGGAAVVRTAAVLRRLVHVLSKYRSYLPNSLFVGEGIQAFDDDADEDDEQQHPRRSESGDDSDADDAMSPRATFGDKRQLKKDALLSNSPTLLNGGNNSHTGGGGAMVGASSTAAAPTNLDPYLLMEKSSHFRRRWSTILYVSVVGAIVDSTQVQDIAERFCGVVIPRVTAARAVIDRLGPTSILATFNCHTPCVIHESEAATCALGIAADLSQFVDFQFAIVIASGYNYIGTCGVDTHRARVVLGESVDLVHRLLPLAATTLGCRILLTEDTANKIGFETAPIDNVQLSPQGTLFLREKAITLFELRSSRKENAPQSLASAFSNAFSSMRSGDYVNALNTLRNYMDRNPSDFQARRLAALCEPFARDMIQQAAIKNQSTTSLSSIMQQHHYHFHPYVRKETLWEVSKAEEAFVQSQRTEVAQLVVSASSGVGMSTVAVDLCDTVRQHFQTQRLDYQEDGLVSMFLPADDDEGAEDRPAEALGNFTEQEMLSTEVPKVFDDANKKKWRRSMNSIGEGAFARLYLALGEQGDLVAMKCFTMVNQRTQTEELIQEVNTLSSLRNDYIVGYVGYAVTPNHFIILMEYVSGGSISQMLTQFGPLPMPAAKRYLIDILKGLRYLHDHQTTHCDIKPHNALLANDGTCKISDFGSSVNNQIRKQDVEGTTTGEATNSGGGGGGGGVIGDDQLLVRGTSWYLSPEAAKGEVRPSNDIWSLGITFIEMITGRHPWTFKGSEAAFIISLGKDETMIPPLSSQIPDDAKAFLSLCFQRDPSKRPTAQQLLQHSFLT